MKLLNKLILILFIILISSCSKNIKPPIAKEVDFSYEIHGEKITDPYRWMHEKESQELINYIEAENKYTHFKLKDIKNEQTAIYNEIIERMNENDVSCPIENEGYFYYYRSIKGQNYSPYCRKKGSLDAQEEILFDPNKEAKNHDYFSVGLYSISPNHQRLAYSIDTDGSERYELWIKDLNTGKSVKYADRLDDFCWALDNEGFFYTTVNDQFRSDKLFRHVGLEPKNDELIYEEKNAEFGITIYRTRDDSIFVYDRYSTNENEAFYLYTNNFTGDFTLVQQLVKDISYTVYHHEKDFYLLTNENAKNNKLVKIVNLEDNIYEDVIPHDDKVTITSLSLFKDFFVVRERQNATLSLKIINLGNSQEYTIPTANPYFEIYQGSNPDYRTKKLRYVQESYFSPSSIRTIDIETKEITIIKTDKVNNFNSSLYDVKRVYVKSLDDVEVPLTLLYKKGIDLQGKNPTLITSYGSYGDSQDPYFSSSRISLLDRNLIIAIAHIRGGGDNGKDWYDNGKMLKKKNTFYDFNACTEFLRKNNYSSKIVASGGSAGGMLMGAISNMRPELYDGIIADVPFVDVLNTMMDPDLPLTVGEYQEWGNPNIKKYFDYIRSYSPYDNVKAQNYPHILALAGWNDARVSYWEAAKWVAKIRKTRTNNNLLLLSTNMNSGHSGNSGRYDFIDEIAFNYAFIIKVVSE